MLHFTIFSIVAAVENSELSLLLIRIKNIVNYDKRIVQHSRDSRNPISTENSRKGWHVRVVM